MTNFPVSVTTVLSPVVLFFSAASLLLLLLFFDLCSNSGVVGLRTTLAEDHDAEQAKDLLRCFNESAMNGRHKLGAPEIVPDYPILSVDDLADQIAEVLNFFGLSAVMCMGVAAGAYILTLFAMKYRQRVLGLILVSPLCKEPSWTDAKKRDHYYSLAKDFLEITPRKTIGELKECKEDGDYAVYGTIMGVIGGPDWFVAQCRCGTEVVLKLGSYYCEKSSKHVDLFSLKYRIKVKVIDSSGSATFVIFEKLGCLLLHKSCTEIFII
ncbi:hypothetical protein Ahy_B04g072479 [Arachis hypogaea]|uniref:Uncharacterized protein n=1 Tax=Arachis hypogaea TaxID=3818 RepID=A0A444ZN45_ARAHY|nr:hypothetical protein Ahy_B04g072479 [Arachis hypogaea]